VVQRNSPFTLEINENRRYEDWLWGILTGAMRSGPAWSHTTGWGGFLLLTARGRDRMRAMFPLVRSRRSLAMRLTGGLMLLLALGAAIVLSVVGAAPASAHTVLVKITPLAGAELTTEPTEVALEFDEPVNSTFATVVVSTAGGVSVTRGEPAVLGARVRQRLSPSMTSGVYRVAYRVVSNDGHPVSGESSFTLTLAPTAGSATPRSSSPVSSSSRQPTSAVAATAGRSTTSPPPGQRGLPNRLLLPISGALALLASGGGVFLWHRRSR
jgi:copper resistance protein C